MTITRRGAAILSGVWLAAGLRPHVLPAQTVNDVAAWDALMLSPIGALPPMARNTADGDARPNELSIRYGRWRYDLDDAVHNNTGITFAHRFGLLNTELAFTGAFLSLSCGACLAWVSGGVDLHSTVWHGSLEGTAGRTPSVSLGLRTGLGGARYIGEGHAIAGSATAGVSVTGGVPFFWRSRMTAMLMPGFGFGRTASADESLHGTRPYLGAALAWTFPSGLGVDLGTQHVSMSGAPAQVGMGLAWRVR
ncbi:MAG: hypothetical protein NVS1B4_08270 [Gemmatimonadaceae bacterium]